MNTLIPDIDKGDLYTCYVCGGIFVAGLTKEECDAESEALSVTLTGLPYGTVKHEVTCDSCYNAFMAWFETLPAWRKEEMRAEVYAEAERHGAKEAQ